MQITLKEIFENKPSYFLRDEDLTGDKYFDYRFIIDKFKHKNKINTADLILIDHLDFNKFLKEAVKTDNPYKHIQKKICMYDEDEHILSITNCKNDNDDDDNYDDFNQNYINNSEIDDEIDSHKLKRIIKGSVSPKNKRFIINTKIL